MYAFQHLKKHRPRHQHQPLEPKHPSFEIRPSHGGPLQANLRPGTLLANCHSLPLAKASVRFRPYPPLFFPGPPPLAMPVKALLRLVRSRRTIILNRRSNGEAGGVGITSVLLHQSTMQLRMVSTKAENEESICGKWPLGTRTLRSCRRALHTSSPPPVF